jgi:pilus assembly protein CpaF
MNNMQSARSSQSLQELEDQLHRRLMELINLRNLEKLPIQQARDQVADQLRSMIQEERIALNEDERQLIVSDIQNEIFGLGPIESLLADPTISDILVNRFDTCYIERHGKLDHTDVRFRDDDHLMRIIQKIASDVGRRIDESSPMVDARLADGSRVNAIIPPLALDGPVLSIRKFSVDPLRTDDLIRFRSLTPEMAAFVQAAVKARINIIISGGTGSGKTTLLNVVSGFIPDNERIITIEDSAELQLQQPHIVRLETRPPNIEGKGEVRQRQLVRNALRMRPDRIVVGEVRGDEALDMLQAMNTGHDGSLSTIHANTARDALTRLEHMVGMSGIPIPAQVVRQQVAAAIHLVIQTERMPDGRRVVSSIQEITGMEQSVVNMQEIFAFHRKGVDSRGKVLGEFRASGIRPQMLTRFIERGIHLDVGVFDPEKAYE